MRVTNNTNFNAVRNSIHQTKARMEELQKQASTLKKVNTPSDSPVGSSKILELRTEKVNNDQFRTNTKLAEAFLNNSDHVVSELVNVVVRAKEIALNQSSGASSTDETRFGVAEEVSQLYKQAVSTANTRVGDRFLFSGYQTDQPPVDGKGNYVGDDGETMIEISRDIYVAMNVPGIEVFNTNPKTSNDGLQLWGQPGERKVANEEGQKELHTSGLAPAGEENVNVFSELQALRSALLSGNVQGIRATLDRFDQIHAHLVANRAKIGSRISGLTGNLTAMERHNLTNAQLNTELEDADLATVLSEISKEESVLRSVLSGSTKLVQPTLMDFLR